MFEAADIREWRGQRVVDQDGEKIGELEAVYVDTATDQPAFGTVLTGFVGRRKLTFVPFAGATVGPDYLKVAWSKAVVKDAPSIDTDGELLAEDEPGVLAHYGLDAGTGGGRRLARR
ncbi:PRC-barrel domain-containing protein [Pseudokineococcus lusitanus]|uniref:PRC-barrel domain protein n=1 Tax=Pseudokineococcus lusitanus TaxID=763993 RepID=A0A3N1HLD0_9ACTN|nr:PRC-barrel domain-containing protein [Pseudokineococcus lusitanus]ROP43310.1 PRC-barrel domain protein [Pseudokineococcus lusitanus]